MRKILTIRDKSKEGKYMDNCDTNSNHISNQKVITKNRHLIIRCEEGWKRRVRGISESLGVPTSVFIRESVNKQINSFTQ